MDSKNQNLIYKDIKKLSTFIKNDVRKYLINNTTFKYSKKIDIMDAFTFDILNTKKHSTKEKSTTQLCNHKQIKFSRQAISKTSDKITSINYNKISENLCNEFLLSIDDNKNNDIDTVKIDGTKIRIYDKKSVNGYKSIFLLGEVKQKDIPLGLYINDSKNNDSETELFYQRINKIEKGSTIVVDGLYFNSKFVNKCKINNINFIAKLKKNSLNLIKYKVLNTKETYKKKTKITKYTKSEINDKIITQIKQKNKKKQENIIEIEEENCNKNDYVVDYKNQKLRIITFTNKEKVIHLCTDLLDKKYEKIVKDYKERWDVELYFKITKNNTNIEHIKGEDTEKINKQISTTYLATILYNIILNIYKKHTQTDKLINNSNFIDGFYNYLLFELINKLTFSKCMFLLNISIILYKSTNKEDHERTSIMPYTKWHYKSKFCKIK